MKIIILREGLSSLIQVITKEKVDHAGRATVLEETGQSESVMGESCAQEVVSKSVHNRKFRE